ncbi:MAG: thiamine phosphate synthase [Gemmatimonadota bacterium]|nr:thiamine phosphate synthase [Gemmatimonadota bacterium]
MTTGERPGKRAAGAGGLARRLRLVVLTRPRPACGRPLEAVVRACVEAGATAVQLRDKEADAADLYRTARRIVPLVEAAGALLFVNDRFDVALAAGAHGVHLGPADLPVAAVRAAVPPGFLIGASTDDPQEARSLAAAGADYLGVGAVYGTRSKPGLADEAIGPARVAAVRAAAGVPCVGIGGITARNAGEVFAAADGVAVLSAVMSAPDPAAAVRAVLAVRASRSVSG